MCFLRRRRRGLTGWTEGLTDVKKPKKIILYVVSVILAAACQGAFGTHLRILGAMPHTVPVILLIFALYMTPFEALVTGSLTGLFLDGLYGRYPGFYVILAMYFAIIASLAGHAMAERKKRYLAYAFMPAAGFLFTVIESLGVRLTALYVSKGAQLYEYGFWKHFTVRILPVTLYDIILSAALLPLYMWIFGKMEPKPVLEMQRN